MSFGKLGAMGRGFGHLGALGKAGGSALVPAGAAATAALARLPNTPSTTTRNKMVTAINALDAGGYWSKFDFFYWLAADNTPNAHTDLTGNGHTAAPFHGMLFFPKYGYQGDGASGFITSTFVPSTMGVNFTLNSSSFGQVIANSRTTPQPWISMGSIDDSGSNYEQLGPLFTGGIAVGGMSTAAALTVANSNAQGVWICSRTSASRTDLYKNGVSIVSGSNASAAIGTKEVLIGARWLNPSSQDGCTGDTIACAFAASGFSAGDAAAISSILSGLIPASIPSITDAWGFTNTTLDYNPTGTSDIDLALANDPAKSWFLTSFWGQGNPSGGDITYSSGSVINTPSVNKSLYRTRVSSRGNTSSVFQGSISGTTLTVSAMIGINPTTTQGGTAQAYPVQVGQHVAGANMGVNQPSAGPVILQQLSGTPGGAGTYQLDTNMGTVASELMCGYSHVGSIPAFKPGGFFEFRASFDPNLSPASPLAGDIITLQMVSLNSLFGRKFADITQSTKMSGIEMDLLQLAPNNAGGAANMQMGIFAGNEIVPADYGDWTYTANYVGGLTPARLGNPTFTNSNKYQLLWIPSFLNGGIGIMQWFFNDKLIGDAYITYSANGLAGGGDAWAPGPWGNFAGNMFVGESDKMVLQYDGGFGQPLSIQGIKVKQTP